MASSSQRRCVFVGNIPYDVTEERLIEICREVGPVVSFRLVIDRETGKPKGYGFCEYKDEETALSARRNLQGYEINGRQLRVDFAENDKGADRNREHAHGGPVLPATAGITEPQKQIGGAAVSGDLNIHQPMGVHLARTAASMMADALGGPQIGLQSTQSTPQVQAIDPLTLHLAKMSRTQLTDIVSSLKLMASQNKEQARQLLLSRPQLLKAVFQAQIMLGIVSPQVLQMPNIVLAQDHIKGSSIQPLHALRSQPPSHPSHSQFSVPQHSSKEPFLPIPQHSIPQKPAQLDPSGAPFSSAILSSVRPQIQVPTSILNENPPFQRQTQVAAPASASTSLGHIHSSVLPRPPLPNSVPLQRGQAVSSSIGSRINIDGSTQSTSRPVKMMKMSDPVVTNQASRSEQMQHREKHVTQTLAPDVQSTLLQQVLNLTPEQLSLLAPEQRQEVMRLQQALRQDQMAQPS